MWGPARVDGVSQFPIYDDLGVGIYQTALGWDTIAPTRPANPRDPNDPAYQWPEPVDFAVAEAARYGMQVSAVLALCPAVGERGQGAQLGADRPTGLRRLRGRGRPALPEHPPLDGLGRALAPDAVQAAGARHQAHEADHARPARGARALRAHPRFGLRGVEGGQLAKHRDRRQHLHHRRHLAPQVPEGDEASERQAAAPRPLRAQPVHRCAARRSRRSRSLPATASRTSPTSTRWRAGSTAPTARASKRPKLFLSEFFVPTDHFNHEFNFYVSRRTQANWLARRAADHAGAGRASTRSAGSSSTTSRRGPGRRGQPRADRHRRPQEALVLRVQEGLADGAVCYLERPR